MSIYFKRMKVVHGGKQTYTHLYIAVIIKSKFHAVIEAKKTQNKIWILLIPTWNITRI